MFAKILMLGGLLGGGVFGVVENNRSAKNHLSQHRKPSAIRQRRSRQQLKQATLVSSRHDADRKVRIAGVSLGLATVGAVGYPTLSLLSIPGLLFVSLDILRSAGDSLLKHRKANIDLPISIIIVACIFKGYFFACTLNAFLAMLSRRLLLAVRSDSQSQVIDIFRQQPRSAWLLTNGSEIEVPTDTLQLGDIVLVGAGETIPTDGTIVAGFAAIDQQLLTGESQPAERGVGEGVFALTLVLSGRIQVRVEKAGEDTTAAQIGKVLNQTINVKTERQLWAESLGERAVVPLMVLSGLCWPVLGPTSALAVLNAHPKYKTTIASYIGILNYLAMASKQGILIKDGRVLERLNQVDTVVFDKTGTLTQDEPQMVQIHAFATLDETRVLHCAALAECRQSHPIARAIVSAATARGLPLGHSGEADYHIGYGLQVNTTWGLVRVGSNRYMREQQLAIPAQGSAVEERCHLAGHGLVFVALDETVVGAIELHATVRDEAQAIIQGLRQRGVRSISIISGDHPNPTRTLADFLAVDQFYAAVLPENKADIIAELQHQGRTVCFIGDGINDSIALKKADVSISLCGASAVATDTAQIVLMDATLRQLCKTFDLARAYDANTRSTFACVLAPHFLSLGGAMFLNFGLIDSIMLNQSGLAVGVANAMAPRVSQQLEWARPVTAQHSEAVD